MKGFFRSIGRGILYFLTPFAWVIGIAIGSVVALIVFICYAIYFIYCFFTGRNLFKDLPEDKKAKEILAAQNNPEPQPAPAPAPQTQVYMNNPQVNLYQAPGYPYPPQPGYPYPPQPGMPGMNPYPQPQPSVQVTVQPQAEPIAMQEAPQIEVQPEPEPELEPVFEHEEIEEIVNVPEPEEDESDFDSLTTDDEEEMGEYIPEGGSVSKKDLRDDDND